MIFGINHKANHMCFTTHYLTLALIPLQQDTRHSDKDNRSNIYSVTDLPAYKDRKLLTKRNKMVIRSFPKIYCTTRPAEPLR